MLGDWLAANASLTHLVYVLCCRLLFKRTPMRDVVFVLKFSFAAIALSVLIMLPRCTYVSKKGSIRGNEIEDNGLAGLLQGLKNNITLAALA